MRKNFKKFISASLIVGGLAFSPNIYYSPIFTTAQAEIKMYVGTGEDYPSQIESQEIAKLRAKDKAVKKAVEQAGVILKSYARTINANLTDNEITAIASNTYELIGEPTYERVIQQVTDETTVIVWKATVNVNVDDSEIKNWLKLGTDSKDKILEQNKQIQISSAENDKQVENLRQRAKNITNDTEREQIKNEFDKVDNDFLSIQKLEEANKLRYAKQYTAAVNVVNEALKFNPNNKDAWHFLGDIYYSHLTDKEKAFECYKKVIELDPNYAKAWNMIGLYYFYDLNDKNKAIEAYNRSIEICKKNLQENPNDLDSLYELCNAYFTLGDKNNNFECHKKIVEIAPNDSRSWFMFGTYYSTVAKDYNKAVECFEKALSISPDDLNSWSLLGIQYEFHLKNTNKAIECYNKVISINPNHSNAYTSLGRTYASTGDYVKAEEYYDKAIALAPEEKYFWTSVADFYAEKRFNYVKAVQCYEKALEIAPKDAFNWSQLGYLYMHEIKNYEKAAECYKKALEIKPNDDTYQYMLKSCQEKLRHQAK